MQTHGLKAPHISSVRNDLVSRLFDQAPDRPYCSDNKTASLIWPKELAFAKCSYIQLNQINMINWMVIDLDHEQPFLFEDLLVATPNIVSINKRTGHSQYFYSISGVCTSDKARIHPQTYLKSIKNAYTKALLGDSDFNSPISKNPLSEEWHTYFLHKDMYSLGELADFHDIKLEVTNFYQSSNDEDYESRNCSVFNNARKIAYREVETYKRNKSFNDFQLRIENVCEKLNNFIGKGYTAGENLAPNEIKNIAKSISNWVWDKYVGTGRTHKGIMKLKGSNLDLRTKQRLSAERTHQTKQNNSKRKIKSAVDKLLSEGCLKITHHAIAQLSGLSRHTVSKYKELLQVNNEAIEVRNITELKVTNILPLNVVFGVTSDNSALERPKMAQAPIRTYNIQDPLSQMCCVSKENDNTS